MSGSKPPVFRLVLIVAAAVVALSGMLQATAWHLSHAHATHQSAASKYSDMFIKQSVGTLIVDSSPITSGSRDSSWSRMGIPNGPCELQVPVWENQERGIVIEHIPCPGTKGFTPQAAREIEMYILDQAIRDQEMWGAVRQSRNTT